MIIAISSGHSTKCRGAVGLIDEVDEAKHVMLEVAIMLRERGVETHTYQDTVSKTQNENLNRIVDWHNSRAQDIAVSVHFNAFEPTDDGRGVEVLYYSQKDLAADVSKAIAAAGKLTDRGAKHRPDLFVLAHTEAPAIMLEVCFVDSGHDVEQYHTRFTEICEAIAATLSGISDITEVPPEPADDALFQVIGKCSHFGGPDDYGVSPEEGLAFHYELTEANQHLFLPFQPHDTTGLARRLNAKAVHYCAARWNYDVTPKAMLATETKALVTSRSTGASAFAFCADWGPHGATSRVCDLSPALMQSLGLETDDEVELIYPAPADNQPED